MVKHMKERNRFYNFVKIVVYPFFMLLYHPKIINSKIIPKDNVILVGNHTSNLDGLLLVASTKRYVHFLAKSELFEGKIKNFFFKNMGFIPVNRKTKNQEALTKAIKCLNEEKVIAIFPEGTINKTKEIVMPFKFGAISLASKTKSPIVPFAIVNKYKTFKKSVKIVFGEPYKLKTDDLELENELLMKKVIKLIEENRN